MSDVQERARELAQQWLAIEQNLDADGSPMVNAIMQLARGFQAAEAELAALRKVAQAAARLDGEVDEHGMPTGRWWPSRLQELRAALSGPEGGT